MNKIIQVIIQVIQKYFYNLCKEKTKERAEINKHVYRPLLKKLVVNTNFKVTSCPNHNDIQEWLDSINDIVEQYNITEAYIKNRLIKHRLEKLKNIWIIEKNNYFKDRMDKELTYAKDYFTDSSIDLTQLLEEIRQEIVADIENKKII